jgi:ABC-type hemin transport system ATPase subunit
MPCAVATLDHRDVRSVEGGSRLRRTLARLNAGAHDRRQQRDYEGEDPERALRLPRPSGTVRTLRALRFHNLCRNPKVRAENFTPLLFVIPE